MPKILDPTKAVDINFFTDDIVIAQNGKQLVLTHYQAEALGRLLATKYFNGSITSKKYIDKNTNKQKKAGKSHAS